MNILIISRDGEILGIADRLSREGHSVKVLCSAKKTGRGIYECIPQPEIYSALKWCKYIISDVELTEELHTKVGMYNKTLIGTSHFTNKANADFILRYAIMDKMKVKMPASKAVTAMSDIYKAVQDMNLPRYHMKYLNTFHEGKHTGFMSWAAMQIPPNQTVVLQEPIEGDTKVRAIGLFNGEEFLRPMFVTTRDNEFNKCCVVAPLKDDDKLVSQNLTRLTEWLRTVDYHGPVTVDLTLVDKEVYCTDFSMGFSFPDIYAILDGLDIPVSKLFNMLSLGITEKMEYQGKYWGSISATSKEWRDLEGAPITNIEKPDNNKHVFPVGVMKSDVDKDEFFVSGECETVYTACSYATTISEVRKRLLRTMNENEFPTMTFNPHIHLTANYPFSCLKSRNYING